METLAEKTTQINVGTSTHRDFFQRGREAAQMAKTQRAHTQPGLVLALSDAGVHFKDFIEGVRLVMGDNLLIGLPTEPWLAQDAPSHEAGAVLILSSKTSDFFVMSHRTSLDRPEVGTTQLAAASHRHQANGLLVFGDDEIVSEPAFQHALISDTGPDTWALGGGWAFKSGNSMACQNQFLNHGVAGIGIRSNTPWSIASVGLEAFRKQPQFLEEGIKTAARSAMQQNKDDAAFGLIFLNGFGDLDSHEAHRALSQSLSLTCPHVPWLGLRTDAHFVHHSDRWHTATNDMLTLALVPS